MVDLCNFACVGDSKDRLIRNSIVAGLSSQKLTNSVSQRAPASPSMNVSKSARQRMQHTDKYKFFDQSLQTAWTVHQYTK